MSPVEHLHAAARLPQAAADPMNPSRFLTFSPQEWAALRAHTPLTLSEEELASLRGLNENISIDEVERIYLPLSRLLNLQVAGTRAVNTALLTFLGEHGSSVPFVIGIAGSVAVGKSTTARVIQAVLARWPDHPRVDLVTTDGFLYPNAQLEARGLQNRKGFPESYDLRRLVRFLSDVKAGQAEVAAPIYSHAAYDIVPDAVEVVRQPDILIVEGLNVLQPGTAPNSHVAVSDFFDFTIYVDAHEDHVESWYIDRFRKLKAAAETNPNAWMHRLAGMSEFETVRFAKSVWRGINKVNLHENILPTIDRAHLILRKGANHRVEQIRLRRV